MGANKWRHPSPPRAGPRNRNVVNCIRWKGSVWCIFVSQFCTFLLRISLMNNSYSPGDRPHHPVWICHWWGATAKKKSVEHSLQHSYHPTIGICSSISSCPQICPPPKKNKIKEYGCMPIRACLAYAIDSTLAYQESRTSIFAVLGRQKSI